MTQQSITDHFYLRKRPANSGDGLPARERGTTFSNNARPEQKGSQQDLFDGGLDARERKIFKGVRTNVRKRKSRVRFSSEFSTFSLHRTQEVAARNGGRVTETRTVYGEKLHGQIVEKKQDAANHGDSEPLPEPAYKRFKHLVEDDGVKSTSIEGKVVKTAAQAGNCEVSRNQLRKDISSSGKTKDSNTSLWHQTAECADKNVSGEKQHFAGRCTDMKEDDKRDTEAVSAPAFERYQHLVDSLDLPHHYRVLAEKFRCVDTVVSLRKKQRQTSTFDRVKGSVEQMCRRSFEKKNLGQMKTVFPQAYKFRQEKGLPYSNDSKEKSDYQLTVDINVNALESPGDCKEQEGSHNDSHMSLVSQPIRPSMLVARRKRFHNGLIGIVKHHHEDFLRSQQIKIDFTKVKRWHPKFSLDRIPDVVEAPLPQPPVSKTCQTANDLLHNAKDRLAPKVVTALETVVQKSKEGGEQESTCDASSTTEGSCASSVANLHPGLRGVSSSLLERVRAKERERIAETLTRDPAVDQKLTLMSRLPEVCRVLRSAFIAERKSALLWDSVVKKLSDSFSSGMSTMSAVEHLELLAQLVPSWFSIVDIRHTKYVKLDRKADLSQTIAKIKQEEKTLTGGYS